MRPSARAQTSELGVGSNDFIELERRNTRAQANFLEFLDNLSDAVASARAIKDINVHKAGFILTLLEVQNFDASA
jgi:hypothetical protein